VQDTDETIIRSENIKRLSTFRSEIQFESQMLSSRLGAYLSSQSFLIIAYASYMNDGWSKPGPFVLLVPFPMALLGIVLSLDALRAIRSSYGVIQQWNDRQNTLLEQHGYLADYWPTHLARIGRCVIRPSVAGFAKARFLPYARLGYSGSPGSILPA
jgi:hypothetical protein